jgi:DNA gyrase subunit A
MRFKSKDLKPTGRTSRGCRAIKLRGGDEMVDIDILAAAEHSDRYGGPPTDEEGRASRSRHVLLPLPGISLR